MELSCLRSTTIAVNASTFGHIITATGLNKHHLHKEWGTSTGVVSQWMSSKHPPHVAERAAEKALTNMVTLLGVLEDSFAQLPACTLLVRSFRQADVLNDLVGWEWTGAQHNAVIQHLLVLDATGKLARHPDTRIMVVSDSVWPTDDDSLTLALDLQTPTVAIAHRDAQKASIDLCVPRTGVDDPRPWVQAAKDVTAVDRIEVPLPLGEEDVNSNGLWVEKSIIRTLVGAGYSHIEDCRLSGYGHPIATTTVLPTELGKYRVL